MNTRNPFLGNAVQITPTCNDWQFYNPPPFNCGYIVFNYIFMYDRCELVMAANPLKRPPESFIPISKPHH